jgi:hypothetical protein
MNKLEDFLKHLHKPVVMISVFGIIASALILSLILLIKGSVS